jgi:hypothetical protein
MISHMMTDCQSVFITFGLDFTGYFIDGTGISRILLLHDSTLECTLERILVVADELMLCY